MDRHTAGKLPGWRVMRFFLTGDSRGDSKIKRGLGCRPGMQVELSEVSAHTRALPQALRAAWNGDFPAPELTLLRPLGMRDSTPH